MKYTRNAYTLMEMLAVIAALVVLTALSAKPMRTLLSDVPRTSRDFQVWTQTQDMLEQLKKDVEGATQISIIDADTDSRLLRLQQPGELVSYSLRNDNVIRKAGTSQDSWELPHVKINWQVWKNDNSPYAIEISTRAEHIVLDKVRKRFEQSFVYFQKTGSLKP